MTAAFVIDCSVAMTWCFLDEAAPATKRLFERMASETALAPAWWRIELTNVLAMAERAGRIGREKAHEFIALVESLNIELDFEGPERAFEHLLPLCRAHQLTSYDAMYLELAIRRRLPLATLDDALRKATRKVGVELLAR